MGTLTKRDFVAGACLDAGEYKKVMNTKEVAFQRIFGFLEGSKRCMLVTGTHQYKKHLLVMAAIDKAYKNANILFRTNALQNITDHSFLGEFITKQPKAGERFEVGKNNYYADSFTNRRTWWSLPQRRDCAIVYPIDAIVSGDVKIDCIEQLLDETDVKKLFLISWTDHNETYSILDKYVEDRTIYDAEAEDPDYHKRMLDLDRRL